MSLKNRRQIFQWRTVQVFLALCLTTLVEGQIRYSILEELEQGTAIGNVANDLGIDINSLHNRKFRMTYETGKQYFEMNLLNGMMIIKHKIDREELCGSSLTCLMNVKVVLDNPLELYHIEIEIVDINDNSPYFPGSTSSLIIAESTPIGTHFPVESAVDPDVGTNSLRSYHLTSNDFFSLEAVIVEGRTKSVEMALIKALDREQQSVHRLTLTAVDGGNPERSGVIQIVIQVQDANDNPPVFNSIEYKVKTLENAPIGMLLIKLNATDLDEGVNAEIVYSFSNLILSEIKKKFSIHPESGEIRVQGLLDFEEKNTYELHIEATNKGPLSMKAHSKVLVDIIDLNDNIPEIHLTSFSSPVREDAKPGLVIALFMVTDKDSGLNGQVRCETPVDLPFQLESTFPNHYSLVLRKPLDHEVAAEYNLTILARDSGTPPLFTVETIGLLVTDVNDNPPRFAESSYTISIAENDVWRSPVFQVSALDPDSDANGRVRYSILESMIDGVSVSGLLSVHSHTGHIFALQSFDYEKLQMFHFQIEATDSGSPSMSSNTNVTVFITDENDNPPVICPPFSNNVLVTRSSNIGELVAKITAVDADSGYNAWLSYEFKDPQSSSSFRIGLYTGEIRIARPFQEMHVEKMKLVILVKDHGKPSHSATTTLAISLVESNQEVKSDYRHIPAEENNFTNLNVYLIISIASILGIFLFTAILYVALWYFKTKREASVFVSSEVCSDARGNWSYSQNKQYSLYLTTESSNLNSLIHKSLFPEQAWNNNRKDEGITGDLLQISNTTENDGKTLCEPKQPHPDWRYSASLRAGMQSAVHMEESGVLRGGPGGPEQQWPTVSSATLEPEPGEVSPPVGAGVNSNSWTFKYGPGNPKQPVPPIPPDFPDNFIIPGSPAIISIRQDQQPNPRSKGNFITFGKKEETKKRKKKKKGNKNQEKKEKGHSPTDNSDQ